MRVVSLVPSWTETLLDAGVDVVGRTRFCIHPKGRVDNIPIVGGTKNVDVDRLRALRPDLLILDREENPREMTEIFPDRWWASDVRSLEDLRRDWRSLGDLLENETFMAPLDVLNDVLTRGRRPLTERPPAFMEAVGQATWTGSAPYVIWRGPWMVVNRGTFISSMLWQLGVDLRVPNDENLYPRVGEAWLRSMPALFSSEPYPFGQKAQLLANEGLNGWIVNGESLSWFGIRAVRFLAREYGLEK